MFPILGLHGSSGHPAMIRSVIDELAPDADVYCPMGPFPDGDGYTFFKRNPDFSIPVEAVISLAKESISSNGLFAESLDGAILVIGYSSGAIFATALLAVAPQSFVGAVLFRPQVLSADFVFPNLTQKPVLIISGNHDIRREPQHSLQLVHQLRDAGAHVTHHELDAGHGWASANRDIVLARTWMAETFP